jgi:tetratricopeptide (TPR) repeat protein
MEYAYPPPTDEWAFETFSMRLLRVYWPASDPQRYGRRGQRQHGVDIIDESGLEPLRAAQCKFKTFGHLLTEAEVMAETEKAKQFTPAIGHYFILTTSERSTDVQRAVVKLNQEHRRRNLFRITVLTWDRIEEILRENRELWSLCIDPPVQQAIEPVYKEVVSISRRMDVLIPSSVEDEYDAKLESVRHQLDAHDRQAAKVILRQLRANRWSELSERQRFLTLTYLAQVGFAEGNWREAGQLFISAKQYQPDEERAQVNTALGHELLGEKETAHHMAHELAQAYPHSSRPWAIICRTAPSENTAAQLEEALPNHVRGDAEVLVAVAMRALRHNDWDRAVQLAQQATQGEKEWSAPWFILAQARLQQAIATGLKLTTEPLVAAHPSTLKDVIYLFDRAVDIAERTQAEDQTIQALLERGRAKRLTGDYGGADDDFARAHNLAPHDAEVLYHYGLHLFYRGRGEAALSLLREAVNVGAGGDAAFMLALALRSQNEEQHRSEWLKWVVEAAGDPHASLQLEAAEFSVDALIENDRIADAQQLVEHLGQCSLADIALDTLRARLELAQDHREQALQCASSVRERLTHHTKARIVRLLAETYCRLGDHGTALPLWEHVVDETKQITDVWQLIGTARRLRRYDIVRRVCRVWREAGISDATLLNAELEVLERFAPHEALELLKEEVARHPENTLLQLRLSLLALRLDRRELVCRDVRSLPKPDHVEVHNGEMVVHILTEVGAFEAALKYAYDLFRNNQESPIAHSTLACLVIGSGLPDDLFSPSVAVTPSMAVSFVEEGTNDVQWRVIEDHPEGPALPEDLRPDHGFAKRLLGLHTGEMFVLAGDAVDGRKAVVRDIVSKYVYRANKCMNEWQVRFPDEPGIELFRLSPLPQEDGTELPDVLPIIRRTYERQRSIHEVLQTYRESPVSLNLVARATGSHFVDAMVRLASMDDTPLRCCSGDMRAFEEATALMATASVLVLDLSAIVTLTLLKLDERLCDCPMRLVVAADTLHQLRMLREERRHWERTSGWVAPAEGGLGIRLIESSEEAWREERQRIERLIERVATVADVLDCGELADVPPAQRDEMIKFCGQPGAESLILARNSGHVLWSDDFAIALYGQQAFGIRRVWTQAVLLSLVAQGLLMKEEYYAASARLLGYDYVSTRFDSRTLLAAASIADWVPGAQPLKQALVCLTGDNDPKTNLTIAAMFIREIITQPVRHPRHSVVVMAALDSIAAGPLAGVSGDRGLQGVESLLPQGF